MAESTHPGLANTVAAESASTAASVIVAVAQFAPTGDWAANLARLDELVREAVRRGADVVVCPEYSSTFIDPFDSTLAGLAQTLDGPFVSGLIALCQRHGTHIVAGVLEQGSAPGRARNAVVAVNGDGLLARYRKTHLYDAFGQKESDWIEPADLERPQTFEVGGMRFGMMTCYDLRFPEVARTLADADVDVALVPAEWVRGPLKEQQWTTLLSARAIENTMYVAAADHPTPLGIGLSMIVDPRGVQLATLVTDAGVAVAPVDRHTLAQVRRVNPALRLRRYRVVPD